MKKLKYPLDSTDILKRKRQIKRELLASGAVFMEKRIAILSGSTIGDIKSVLELFLLDYDIAPVFYEGEYSRYYEDALFENSELYQFHPDIIYIHVSNKNIDEFPSISDDDISLEHKLNKIYKKFETIWIELMKRYNCIIMQNNFEYLPYRLLGNADVYNKYGKNNFINQLNSRLYEFAKNNHSFYINDINYLASWYGLEKWFNQSHWYLYKYAFDINAIPLLCQNISKIVKSIYGKNKKVLAVDLDNTLWGGVIGDTGVENIKIGEETPEGRAYADFQEYLKQVSELGISINICSKNDEKTALSGFEHEASILKKEDFLLIKANWADKSENIIQITEDLNVGVNSVVFVDDNPAERALIRYNLPEVSIPEMTSPDDYVRILDQQGYFETTSLLEEDVNRNESYRANIKRNQLISNMKDYNGFLKSLNMKCYISRFNNSIVPRITQLINKTNQFNLTTKRVTENEIYEAALENSVISIAARLSDKFGDNGITSAVMVRIVDCEAIIDLWVMSCRVFKRNLEYAMFDELVRLCVLKGVKKVKGIYLPTTKNIIVEKLYENLGFRFDKSYENGTMWEYTIPMEYKNKNQVMEVHYVE